MPSLGCFITTSRLSSAAEELLEDGHFGISDAAKAKNARDAIMRRQFAKLPKAENEWHKAQRKLLRKLFIAESNPSSHYDVETAAVAFENRG
jgi:hypothetical protein